MAAKKVTRRETQRKALLKSEREPNPAEFETKLDLQRALDFYYRQEYNGKRQKSWILHFMKNNGYSEENIKHVNKLPNPLFENRHPYTSLTQLVNLGYVPEEKHFENIKNLISNFISTKIEAPQEKNEKVEELRKKQELDICRKYASEIDHEIDNVIEGKERSFYVEEAVSDGLMKKNHFQYMRNHVVKELKEFEEVKKSDDPEIKYAYAHILNNKIIIKILAFLHDVKASLEKLLSFKPKAQKLTVKKNADPSKIFANFKYKFSDSINPQKILGAWGLIAYNAKYGILYYYKSKDTDGFMVRGGSIYNWDEEKSFAKKLSRKIKDKIEYVKKFRNKKVTEIATMIEGDEVKQLFGNNDPKTHGRINQDTILVTIC